MSKPSQSDLDRPILLTISLISKRTDYSSGGICKVIKRHAIKPVQVVGSLKFYSPEQADQIAALMLPFAKNK